MVGNVSDLEQRMAIYKDRIARLAAHQLRRNPVSYRRRHSAADDGRAPSISTALGARCRSDSGHRVAPPVLELRFYLLGRAAHLFGTDGGAASRDSDLRISLRALFSS